MQPDESVASAGESAWRRGLFAAAVVTLALGLNAAPAAAQTTVEFPVSFQVKNTDTSKVPCNSGVPDGATYTISGHVSGPQAALTSGNAHVVTVYLFGYEAGEWNWDLKGIPGYDYAA